MMLEGYNSQKHSGTIHQQKLEISFELGIHKFGRDKKTT
jgi:hypothetical protein